MQVTTRSVKHPDQKQLMDLVDEGYTHASVRFTEGMAKIEAIGLGMVSMKFPQLSYSTIVKIETLTALHMPEDPDLSQSQTIVVHIPADDRIPLSVLDGFIDRMTQNPGEGQ